MRTHTSWDLPVLRADGVDVKRQQVPEGCRPPLRCSGTTGELICTLSQPSLSRKLARKETAAGGPRRTVGKREGGGRVAGQDYGSAHTPAVAAVGTNLNVFSLITSTRFAVVGASPQLIKVVLSNHRKRQWCVFFFFFLKIGTR